MPKPYPREFRQDVVAVAWKGSGIGYSPASSAGMRVMLMML